MPSCTSYQFVKEYKKDKTKLRRCYLFYGDEITEIEKTVKDILTANLKGSCAGFNKSVFSFETADMDDVKTAVRQVPLFAQKRFVILKGQTPTTVSKSSVGGLTAILKDVPDSTCLILAFLEPDNDYKSSNLKELVKGFSGYGLCVEFVKRGDAEKADFALRYAKSRGVEMERSAAIFLTQRVMGSGLLLKNEMDKLCAYCENGEITKKDILTVTAQNLENTAFELVDKIKGKDVGGSLLILSNLLADNVEPLNILGAINLAFVDIYRAKCIIIEKADRKEIADSYKYGAGGFRLNKAMDAARGYRLKEIVRCLRLLQETDYKTKSSGEDNEILLQNLIVRMIGGEKR